jgi:hypothetical protein
MGFAHHIERWEKAQAAADPNAALSTKRVSWGRVQFSDIEIHQEIVDLNQDPDEFSKVEIETPLSEKFAAGRSRSSSSSSHEVQSVYSKRNQSNGFFDIRKAYNLDEDNSLHNLDDVIDEIPHRYDPDRQEIKKRYQSASAEKHKNSENVTSTHKLKDALMRLAQDNAHRHGIEKQLYSGLNVPIQNTTVPFKHCVTSSTRSDGNIDLPLSSKSERSDSESAAKPKPTATNTTTEMPTALNFVTTPRSDTAPRPAHRAGAPPAPPPRRSRPAPRPASPQPPSSPGPQPAGGCFGFVFGHRTPARPRSRRSG